MFQTLTSEFPDVLARGEVTRTHIAARQMGAPKVKQMKNYFIILWFIIFLFSKKFPGYLIKKTVTIVKSINYYLNNLIVKVVVTVVLLRSGNSW